MKPPLMLPETLPSHPQFNFTLIAASLLGLFVKKLEKYGH
jgi:hypothetical protein